MDRSFLLWSHLHRLHCYQATQANDAEWLERVAAQCVKSIKTRTSTLRISPATAA